MIDWKSLARRIDHTLLKPHASESDGRRACEEARRFGFAALCVAPVYVPLASRLLEGSGVKVCTVVGFPLGSNLMEVKVREAELAIREGASEVDMVMNLAMFKSGKYDYVEEEVRLVKSAVGERVLKVILECCYLSDEEKIQAAKIVEKAGADFVKTSTGFGPSGAKLEDVRLLRKTLSPRVKVKAAGGIRTLRQAISFLEAGADRLGTSSGAEIIREALEERER